MVSPSFLIVFVGGWMDIGYLAELMVLVISSIRVATSLISTSPVRCSLDKTDITWWSEFNAKFLHRRKQFPNLNYLVELYLGFSKMNHILVHCSRHLGLISLQPML